MEKHRLLELLKSEKNDIDAIGMILSNYADYGSNDGCMVSVKQFDKVAKCLIEWWGDNVRTTENLTFKPNLIHSIRGTRYCYEVMKEVENTPGFAPEKFMMNVCDVVVKFIDNEQPYIQFSNNPPSVITIDELKEILSCAEKGFIEQDFINL